MAYPQINNLVVFTGYLTNDVQLEKTTQGKDQVRFTIGMSRKDMNGNTVWDNARIMAHGKEAVYISQNGTKGSVISMQGVLRSSSKKDEQKGLTNYYTYFDVVTCSIKKKEKQYQKEKDIGEPNYQESDYEEYSHDDDMNY